MPSQVSLMNSSVTVRIGTPFQDRGVKRRKEIMGSLGIQEMIVIFVIALIVFGPKKLPEIGKSLGKGIAEFKKASSELVKTWEEEAGAENKPKESQSKKTEA
jgi:sec-independent protein translocase protein TatA